jgi:hypothetical protein
MVAYFYLSKNELEEALECGLKLSVYGKPIPESGDIPIKAIRAYLSPRDNMDDFDNQELVCLKLDLAGDKLLVAEDIYASTGNHKWFNESIIHASKYMLGKYRKPCYLITFTVLNEYISVLDKKRDVPVLYENSAGLYVQTLKSKFEEGDAEFYDKAFYGYMKLLVSMGKATIEWSNDETTIFLMDGERYILQNPANEI